MYKDIWCLMVIILEKLLDRKNEILDKQPSVIERLRKNKKKAEENDG